MNALIEVDIQLLRGDRPNDGVGLVKNDPDSLLPPGATVLFYNLPTPPTSSTVHLQREHLIALPVGVPEHSAVALFHELLMAHILLEPMPNSCALVGVPRPLDTVLAAIAVASGSGVLAVARSANDAADLESLGVAQAYSSPGLPVSRLLKHTAGLGVQAVFVGPNSGLVTQALKLVARDGMVCLVDPGGQAQDRVAVAALREHGSASVRCPDLRVREGSATAIEPHSHAAIRWLSSGMMNFMEPRLRHSARQVDGGEIATVSFSKQVGSKQE